jgi:TolA-binding protein
MKSAHLIFVTLLFVVGVVLSGCSKEPTEDELLKSATRSFSEDDFDKALDDFSLLTKRYPKSDKVPEALYAMGVIYSNKKKEYTKAESIYTKLAMEYPDDPTAASAAYQRARIFAQHLKKPDSAIAAYEYCLRRYPSAMSASAAQTELNELKKPSKPSK